VHWNLFTDRDFFGLLILHDTEWKLFHLFSPNIPFLILEIGYDHREISLCLLKKQRNKAMLGFKIWLTITSYVELINHALWAQNKVVSQWDAANEI
jgi:hypothetical protein